MADTLTQDSTFIVWLKTQRGLNRHSARVYGSRLDSLKKKAPDENLADPVVVKKLLDVDAGARSAYRAYVAFVKETEGTVLPDYQPQLPGPKTGDAKTDEVVRIPEAVIDALVDLLEARLPYTLLERTYWGHFVFNAEKQRFEVPDPEDPTVWMILPREPLSIIHEWAKPLPGEEAYTPLVPVTPSSLRKVNWRWLRPLLQARKRARHQL